MVRVLPYAWAGHGRHRICIVDAGLGLAFRVRVRETATRRTSGRGVSVYGRGIARDSRQSPATETIRTIAVPSSPLSEALGVSLARREIGVRRQGSAFRHRRRHRRQCRVRRTTNPVPRRIHPASAPCAPCVHPASPGKCVQLPHTPCGIPKPSRERFRFSFQVPARPRRRFYPASLRRGRRGGTWGRQRIQRGRYGHSST